MGTATATQPLTASCYLTDGVNLVYVLNLTDGEAVIEDVRNGKVECVAPTALEKWRVVIPEGTDG